MRNNLALNILHECNIHRGKTKNIATLILIGVAFFLCTSVTYAEIGAQPGSELAKILTNLGQDLHKVIKFLVACSYVIGVWFISSAVNELRIYGQARTMMPLQTSFTGPLARLMVGIMMLFFPALIDVSIYSLWGYGVTTASALRFDTTKSSTWDAAMDGLRILIQTLGYISIIRGLIQLSRAGKQGMQPGTFGKGVMHIVGGILAVNIVATVKMFKVSLGLS